MDIQSYFERIGYHGALEPTWQTLRALHEAQLLTVPFENLAIRLGREIVLDEAALWAKIVAHRRGGFCYELNGLFALLLRSPGFRVYLLSAAVATATHGFGPDFDHLTLLVHLEEDRLADVGFGESFREPLRLQAGLVQSQIRNSYRLECEGVSWIYEERDSEWKPAHRFTLQRLCLKSSLNR